MSRSRELVAALAAGVCLLPSAVMNVVPHLAHALESPVGFGVTVFQVVAVAVLGLATFGIKRLDSIWIKAAAWVLVAGLLWNSFLNALDIANLAREVATSHNRGTLNQATGLNSRIKDLKSRRSEVPHFVFTSAAQVTAAESASREAAVARDLECKRVGDKCRQRMDEAKAASEELGRLSAQRGLTEQAEKLDGDRAQAEKDLAALGNVPQVADRTSEQVARMLSPLFKTGEDDVSEWRPVLFAAFVEFLALIGPAIAYAAIAVGNTATQPVAEMPKTDGAGVEIAGVAPSAVSPAKEKKPRKNKKLVDAGLATVREFFKSRTVGRLGNSIRCNEVYDTYKEWCVGQNEEPVSFTRFGTFVKGELGIRFEERGRRGYYCDIAMKGVALRVVSRGA